MADIVAINSSTFKVNHHQWAESEIGDITAVEFRPHLKLKRWGDECSFSILFPTVQRRTPTLINNRLNWSTPAVDLNFYPLDPTIYEGFPQRELGGFEFEIVLKVRPSTNKISLPIVSDGLQFWKQPLRSQLRADEIQPLNVDGSYAVYKINRQLAYNNNAECSEIREAWEFQD